MRRRLSVIVGLVAFAVALAGFLWLQVEAQAGEVRVLTATRTILPGQVLTADTQTLSPNGSLVHLDKAELADAVPQSRYREVAGSVALVEIPAGAIILRHDLAMGRSADLRRVTLSLAYLPSGLDPGSRVDLLAVWGAQTGSAGQGSDLCPAAASTGCVVPLAQAVSLLAVDAASHSITFYVPPAAVSAWLLLDATQPIWAVPAGASTCAGVEHAISDPAQALAEIQQGLTVATACPSGAKAGSPP